MIKLRGEVAVSPMTTDLMALDRKVVGFETSVSELVLVLTVPTPCAGAPGALNNSPNEGRNIEVDVSLDSQHHP